MAGIYIHVPFCGSRCGYCAFYSTVSDDGVRRRYVGRLCREIAERKDFLGGGVVSSVYIGGGTPSRLSARELADIFNALAANFSVEADAEITIEVNPDDITPAYAAMLHSLPANRVSMGVQSFHDETLRAIGRRHSALGARRAYAALREAGFDNISLDLIYALPGENEAMWESDLRETVALRPEHISAYALSFEPDTRLYGELREGVVAEASDDLYERMYATLSETLDAAGYERYEISNFALPGRRARHNSSYWSGAPYLGLGAGAHSYRAGERRMNLPDLPRYLDEVDVPCRVERLSEAEEYDEFVMTRLRTCEGIDMAELESRFGSGAREYIAGAAAPYVASGRLELSHGESGLRLRLSHSGVMVSDTIISDLMNPD